MQFENIGGNLSSTQFSLYDYAENPNGETVMSIEIRRDSGTWWFVGEPKDEMNIEHMKALYKFLKEQLR